MEQYPERVLAMLQLHVLLGREQGVEQHLQLHQIVITQGLRVPQDQLTMQQHALLQDITDLQVQIQAQVEVRVHQDQPIHQIKVLHQVLVQEAHINHDQQEALP